MTSSDEKTLSEHGQPELTGNKLGFGKDNLVGKRSYHTPGFVHYGSVTSIVKNQQGTGGDGGGGFANDTLS